MAGHIKRVAHTHGMVTSEPFTQTGAEGFASRQPLTLQHKDGLGTIRVDVGSHGHALIQGELGQGDDAGVEHTACTLPVALDNAAKVLWHVLQWAARHGHDHIRGLAWWHVLVSSSCTTCQASVLVGLRAISHHVPVVKDVLQVCLTGG